MVPWAVPPVRLLVGYGFIEHGFAKLSKGPDVFAGILQQLGVPMPHVAAGLTISTELLGGLALLLGAFVVWASIPTALVLLVAMVIVHLPYGFSSVKLLSVSASGARFGPVGYELSTSLRSSSLRFRGLVRFRLTMCGNEGPGIKIAALGTLTNVKPNRSIALSQPIAGGGLRT